MDLARDESRTRRLAGETREKKDLLVDDGEGSVRQLDAAEKVHDGGKGSFLEGGSREGQFEQSRAKHACSRKSNSLLQTDDEP